MNPGKRLPYFPSEKQELLLQAALFDGEKARQALLSWKSQVSLDSLDLASIRLLPLLYKNLKKWAIHDEDISYYKTLYRDNFLSNSLLLNDMEAIIRLLNVSKIPTLLLKGAALISGKYYEVGDRHMGDIDILVKKSDASKAASLLMESGWKTEEEFDSDLLRYSHAANLKKPSGSSIDLHWHLLAQRKAINPEARFWQLTLDVDLQSTKTQRLNPENQLLHICVHGSRWVTVPAIHWVADAYKVIKSDQDEIDWSQIVSSAIDFDLSLPLIDCLDYLSEMFYLPISSDVIESLSDINVSERAMKEYRAFSGSSPSFDNLAGYWYTFLGARNENTRYKNYRDFPKYLARKWEKPSIWHVFGRLVWLGTMQVVNYGKLKVRNFFSTSKNT